MPNDAPIDFGSPGCNKHSPWQHFYHRIDNFQRHKDFLPAVARLAATVLQAQIGVIILPDAGSRKITIPAIWPDNNDFQHRLKSVQWPNINPASHPVFQIKGPSVVNNIKEASNGLSFIAPLVFDEIRNRAIVPLGSKGMNGFLCVINKMDSLFNDHDIDLLCAIAAITRLGMETMDKRRRQCSSRQTVASFNLAKDHVIHRLSHALKTPLAVLIASVKLLEKHLVQLPDTSWRKITQRAQRNLDRLLTLEYEVEDILRQSDDLTSTSQFETTEHTRSDMSATASNPSSDEPL